MNHATTHIAPHQGPPMSQRYEMSLLELATLADAFAHDPFVLTTEDVANLQTFHALYERQAEPTVH